MMSLRVWNTGILLLIVITFIVAIDTHTATFLQSCGVADLITSCYSSKIQVMADTFIKGGSYKVCRSDVLMC